MLTGGLVKVEPSLFEAFSQRERRDLTQEALSRNVDALFDNPFFHSLGAML